MPQPRQRHLTGDRDGRRVQELGHVLADERHPEHHAGLRVDDHPCGPGEVVGLQARAGHRREVHVDIPPWRTSLIAVAVYAPAWGAIGTATWCLAHALDPHAAFGQVFVAAVLSWIVGFVLVPVPGGIGVREAAFTATAGLATGIGATVAVAARVAFMLVDLIGAVLAPALLRRKKTTGVAGTQIVGTSDARRSGGGNGATPKRSPA